MLISSSAAVAPWFSPNIFGGGAYLTVDRNVGDLIDWVRFCVVDLVATLICDGP